MATARGVVLPLHGRNAGPVCDGMLQIATSRLDPSAELIGDIDRRRWLIEVFFRMFAPMPECRHLLSTKQEGVELPMSCGIVAGLPLSRECFRRADPVARGPGFLS